LLTRNLKLKSQELI